MFRTCGRALLLMAWLLGPTAESRAQSALQVKGAFLPKLAGFVTWPTNAFATPDEPLVIGVLGAHPFGPQYVASLNGVTLRGRKLVLREFNSTSEITNCHLLFLPAQAKLQQASVVRELRGKPVLTVADFDNFAEQGGILNFVVAGGKVRFVINRDAAQKAGLSLDARLLAVSTIVDPPRRAVSGKGGEQ